MPLKKLLPILITFLFTIGVFYLASAQAEQGLSIKITKPSEGETLYAGPTTLMYCINLEGLVSGVDDSTTVQVTLEIIQDSKVILSSKTTPDEDGLFIFPATVNPEGSEGSFTPVQIEAGCERCHYRANLDLPPKAMLLRVSATTPDGQVATAERQITVDLSGYATVPIRVAPVDSSETILSGITVQGATRLYEWRARHPLAATDESGIAVMRLEALSEAPTRYLFYVVPTIIDGVLYQGVETKELTLPSGATSAEQITLKVTGSLGSLAGRFYNSQADLTEQIQVWAVHLPEGKSLQTMSDEQGQFRFPEIPYGRYLLTADARELAQQNLRMENQTAELSQSETGSILMPFRKIDGITLSGTIVDQKGRLIPFAIVTIEGLRQTQKNLASDGSWVFFDLPMDPITLSISAPGYFSEKKEVTTSFLEKGETLVLGLKRRPETEHVDWGKSELIIPPETDARVEENQITINQGWLWGSVEGDEPFTVITPSEEITLMNAQFALEITRGTDSWFYLWEGTAIIERSIDGKQTEIASGEMVALSSSEDLIPIPINPVVDAALHSGSVMLISPVWEQTLGKQIQAKLSSLGTNIIQTITMITYIVILLIIIVVPLWTIIARRRKR